ncbi:MAG TPA: hypothetical protein VK595_10485 [Vicinamibacterales bacterium]|nr:hypothetical protein [Vicinamibacterales bacterium]
MVVRSVRIRRRHTISVGGGTLFARPTAGEQRNIKVPIGTDTVAAKHFEHRLQQDAYVLASVSGMAIRCVKTRPQGHFFQKIAALDQLDLGVQLASVTSDRPRDTALRSALTIGSTRSRLTKMLISASYSLGERSTTRLVIANTATAVRMR